MGTIYIDGQFKSSVKPVKVISESVRGTAPEVVEEMLIIK